MESNISVLMSVYRKEKAEFLDEAIQSIIQQTLKPAQIVLIKDGILTEELDAVIEKWSKRENIFKIISLNENVGLGRALKLGVESCDYEIIARMDTDDICSLTRFEEQLKIINDENIDIVGSIISEFNEDINKIICVKSVPISNDEIYEYGKKRCPLNHPSVMFKKSKVIEAGNYREWHFNEDYDLWFRMMLKKAKFKNINKSLVFMRVNDETFKRRGGGKYFKSEYSLQKYFFKEKYITFLEFIRNIILRVVIQICLPNSIRSFVYKKFLRDNKEYR